MSIDSKNTTPKMNVFGFVALATSGTGTAWVQPGSQEAKQVTVKNATGTNILVRKHAAGDTYPILNNETLDIYGLTDLNELNFKRQDESATQVTVNMMWFK